MNWGSMEVLVTLAAVGFFVASLRVQHTKPALYTETIKPIKKTRSKPNIVDPNLKEAKRMLVDMGYTATEAKTLLQNIEANSAESYISKAMHKVKL